MRFRSTVEHPLRFEMDGVVFEVAPKGECEIPDAKAFAVKGMGLPLVAALEPEHAPAPAPAPTEPKKKPAPAVPAPK